MNTSVKNSYHHKRSSLGKPLVISYPQSRSPPHFRKYNSPYIQSRLLLKSYNSSIEPEIHLLSDSTKDTLIPSVTPKPFEFNPIPEIQSQSPFVCKICGASQREIEMLDELDDYNIVPDVKFSIYCMKILETLSMELCPPSRKLFRQLFAQVNFLIFPEDEIQAVPYCDIYRKLDVLLNESTEENEYLKTALDEKARKLQETEKMQGELMEKLKRYKYMAKRLSSQSQELEGKYHNELTLRKDQEENQRDLQARIDQANAVLIHSKLNTQTKDLQIGQLIQQLELKQDELKQNDGQVYMVKLQKLQKQYSSLKTKLDLYKTELQKQEKLNKTLQKTYKNSVKSTHKEYIDQIANMKDQIILLSKKAKRTEIGDQYCEELSKLIDANIAMLSFDELARVALVAIKSSYDYIDSLSNQIKQLQETIEQLERARQNVLDRYHELKHRADMAALSEESFSFTLQPEGDFFVGLGRSLDIPKYLRSDYLVPYTHFDKKTTLKVINEMWENKIKWQGKMKRNIALSAYLYSFLRQKFNFVDKVVETAYNLIEAADRYQEDPDCDMFLTILKGELAEEAYHDCTRMVRVFRRLALESVINIGTFNGMHCMGYKQILELVQRFMPNKTEKELKILKTLLFQDCKQLFADKESIPVDSLFTQIRETPYGRFITGLRKQYVLDVHKYLNGITKHLHDKAVNNIVKVNDIYDILQVLDPNTEAAVFKQLLGPILGGNAKEMTADVQVSLFLRKLTSVFIRPSYCYKINAEPLRQVTQQCIIPQLLFKIPINLYSYQYADTIS